MGIKYEIRGVTVLGFDFNPIWVSPVTSCLIIVLNCNVVLITPVIVKL